MNNLFVDTHAHVVSKYYENIDTTINKAFDNGIKKIINCSYDIDSAKEIIELTKKFDNMYAIVGIHPLDTDKFNIEDIKEIEKLLNNDKIVAIGEIGLDYHYENFNKEKQLILFKEQLDIASKYNLPVAIHSRDATMDTLNMLKRYNLKGVIHSFSGSLETALEYINMGYYISINGVVTFKNCNLKDILPKIPLNSILLETDCPYLTPVPYRGKQNEPAFIKDIAQFVANTYNITVEELSDITNKNVFKLFNI